MNRSPLVAAGRRLALAALVAAVSAAALVAAPGRAWAQPPAEAPAKADRPPVYDESADAAADIAAALARAKKENRRVLVQWGANWCHWCVLLHESSTKNPALSRKLLYEYDVVRVDIGRADKNMDLAKQYGAPLDKAGIPYLTILDADGTVLANEETGQFEAKTADGKEGHDAGKLVAFLTRHQAPYRSARAILDEGLSRARAEDKLAFVHLGAPWCGWCHRLEDWMARDDVAPILAKNFVDVKLDQDRTTEFADVQAKHELKSSGGIPWFAFMDAEGRIVATSDGPQGNVGFPYAPGEIEHFISMLSSHAKKLSKEDIAALRRTLEERPDDKGRG